MLVLVNKSDYLSPLQRQAWHEYLSDPENPWEHVFFSAHEEQEAALDHRAAEEHAAQDAAFEAAEQLLNESEQYDENDAEEEMPKEEDPEEQVTEKPTKNIFDNVGVESPLT
jgi:predicted kinase